MALTSFDQMVSRAVLTSDGCMEWTGHLARGYGYVRHNGKRTVAHRVAYELERGAIPDGMVIDHLCRNRACINPWHLEATSQAVNVRRGLKGGSVLDDGTFTCRRCGGSNAASHPGRGHGGTVMRCRDCDRARYEANKGRILARQKTRYEAHKDEINAKQRAKWAARKGAANG